MTPSDDPFAGIPDDPASEFTLISLAELYERPDPIYRFMAEGLLPTGGSSIIVAKPKIGKTTLILQLARCVAAGTEFLGREVRQGLVAYLAFEEKDTEVKRKFKAAKVPPEMPIFSYFGAPPDDKLGALQRLIKRRGPSLVVIDTLAYWTGVRDFNSYSEVGEALRPIHALARESETHILCVHHAGKGSGGGSTIDSPLGSTALTANVDTVLSLEEGEGDQRIIASRQRYGDHLPRTVLSFDKGTFTYSVGHTVAENRRREIDEDILQVVGRMSMTQTRIQEQVKCRPQTMTSALNRLVEMNLLRRTGTGAKNSPFMYEAVNPPPPVSSEPVAVNGHRSSEDFDPDDYPF